METFAPKGKIYGPILPQFILEKTLSLGAKIMYALLCDCAGQDDHCWPSQKYLANKLSCSISSVKKYLAELINENLVATQKGQFRSSIYYLLQPQGLGKSSQKKHARQQSNNASHKPESGPRQPKSGYLTNLNNQKENTPPNPPKPSKQKATPKLDEATASAPVARGVCDSSRDFEKLWAAYPKKEAMAFARRIWCKLSKKNKLPPLAELLAAIKWFEETASWQRSEGRFIPFLGNWLINERWLDDEFQAFLKHSQQAARAKSFRPSLQTSTPPQEKSREELEQENRLRQIFNAFLARFSDADAMRKPAWGFWRFLHSKGKAPKAESVPPDNTLGVLSYLKVCDAA